MPERLVIGVGSEARGDDAAGLLAARAVQAAAPPGTWVLESGGEPAGLVEALGEAREAWLVDAVRAGGPPGTVLRLDASREPLPARIFAASTHLLGIGEAVELARALGRLPPRVVLYGVEGTGWQIGTAPSPEVTAAAEDVARRILGELAAAAGPHAGRGGP